MTIKKYLLIFFFIIFIIIFKWFPKKIETFKAGYISQPTGAYNFLIDRPGVLYPYASRQMNITLNNNVLNPISIIYNEVSVAESYITDKLMTFFPIKKEIINKDFSEAINYVNNNKNKILIINEDIFVDSYLGLQSFKKHKLNNNRFICSLFYSHMTLITPLDSEITSWKNLDSKTIGTIENSQDLMNLIELLSIIGYNKKNVKIYTVPDLLTLQSLFTNSDIDAIYLTVQHPSEFLKKLSDSRKIRFIFTKGIPISTFKFHFPFAFKGKVNLMDYDIYPSKNPIVDSYATRKIIITNKETKQHSIYNLVKNIFENLEYIRQDISYLKVMIPTFISFCSPLLTYHSGAEKFYKENNYITNTSQQLCYLYTGSFECNEKLINKNRFLHDFAVEDNYYKNYTILDSEGNWNNIVNDWNPKNISTKRFTNSEVYTNIPNKPLLISQINFDTETTRIYKNFVNQIKHSSEQLFPNL